MITYLVQRLFLALATLLGITVLTFLLLNVLPGDPVDLLFPYRRDTATVEQIRQELGFTDPLPRRFARFLWGALRGDLGYSLRTREPVADALARRLPVTLRLGLTAFLLGNVLGLSLGVLAAAGHGGWVDRLITVATLAGISTPVFWLALLLQLYLGYELGWAPISGWGTWRHLLLPALTLGCHCAGSVARYTRAFLLDQLGREYVRAARARGLSPGAVLVRHALRNALVPIVTVLGLDLAGLLTGTVLTETVFGIPGIGRLVYEAIFYRDYFLVQGAVLFIGGLFVLANLLVDLTYAWLDPRIRHGAAA